MHKPPSSVIIKMNRQQTIRIFIFWAKLDSVLIETKSDATNDGWMGKDSE